jgi:hypothetical protein
VGFLDSLGIKDMLKKLLIKRTGHVF